MKISVEEYIDKYATEELKTKIKAGPPILRTIFEKSLERIHGLLEQRGKEYGLKAYVWRDIETSDWEENIIGVKATYKDYKEKTQLWQKIEEIVRSEVKNTCQREEVQDINEINSNILTAVTRLRQIKQ